MPIRDPQRRIERFRDGEPVDAPTSEKNPHDKPTKEVKLRLNDYQFEILSALAKEEFSPVHGTILRVLMPAAERRLARLRSKQ